MAAPRAECFDLSFSCSCQRGKSNSETSGSCSPRLCQSLAEESGKTPHWKSTVFIQNLLCTREEVQNANPCPKMLRSLLSSSHAGSKPQSCSWPHAPGTKPSLFLSFLAHLNPNLRSRVHSRLGVLPILPSSKQSCWIQGCLF